MLLVAVGFGALVALGVVLVAVVVWVFAIDDGDAASRGDVESRLLTAAAAVGPVSEEPGFADLVEEHLSGECRTEESGRPDPVLVREFQTEFPPEEIGPLLIEAFAAAGWQIDDPDPPGLQPLRFHRSFHDWSADATVSLWPAHERYRLALVYSGSGGCPDSDGEPQPER